MNIKGFDVIGKLRARLDIEFNNLNQRREFVARQLSLLPAGSSLLDAGAGSQQFRSYASHLKYVSQDFEGYDGSSRAGFTSDDQVYEYGNTDIVGNIWEIDVADDTFDAVLCTEVLEHIPYPHETIRELARVLRPGGTLILTAPSNCLRHMDPYFYSSGFSDRWFEYFLDYYGLQIEKFETIGDYYSWMKVEIFRTLTIHPLSMLALLPALLFYKFRRPTLESEKTLCMGYHVVAKLK